MAGFVGALCNGVILCFIFTAAWLVGAALGQALRANRERRRNEGQLRAQAPERLPSLRGPCQGPLWDNSRIWEEWVLRGHQSQDSEGPANILPEVNRSRVRDAEDSIVARITRRFQGGVERRR